MHATIDYTPERKENAFKPGPGAYEGNFSTTKRREPGWKIGSAVRNDLETSKRLIFTQSPDKYDPNFSATKSAAAKWGFGSEKRKDIAGPGKFTPGAG
jgi:hypothetical protein